MDDSLFCVRIICVATRENMAHLKHWHTGTHFIVTLLSMVSVILSGIINYQGNGSCRLCSNWVNITQSEIEGGVDGAGSAYGNGTSDLICSNIGSSIDLGYFMTIYNAVLMGIQVLFFMSTFTYYTGIQFRDDSFQKHLRLTLASFHTFHIIVLSVTSTLIISFRVSIAGRTACSKTLLYWYYAYLIVNLLHSGAVIGKVVREHCKKPLETIYNAGSMSSLNSNLNPDTREGMVGRYQAYGGVNLGNGTSSVSGNTAYTPGNDSLIFK